MLVQSVTPPKRGYEPHISLSNLDLAITMNYNIITHKLMLIVTKCEDYTILNILLLN